MFTPWLITGVAAALSSASGATYQKRLLTEDDTSALKMGYITNLVATIALLPIVFMLTSGAPPLDSISMPLIISTVTNVVGLLLFLYALDDGELSVIGPMKGLIPVAVAVIEPFVFRTTVTPELFTAVLVTVVGTFILLTDETSILTFVRRLTNRGPLLAVASAMMYAGAILADRYAVSQTDPYTYALTLSIAITAALIISLVYKSEMPTAELTTIPRDHVPLGLFRAGSVLFGLITLSLTTATRATILLQLALLINVLIGVALFKEGHLVKRSIGTVMLIVSIVIVA